MPCPWGKLTGYYRATSVAVVEVQAYTEQWNDPKWGRWLIDTKWAEVGGRMECVGVEVRSYGEHPFGEQMEPRPVSVSMLRALPLGRAIEHRRQRMADFADEMVDTHAASAASSGEHEQWWKQTAARWQAPKPRKGEEHHAYVAAVYLAAQNRGEPPTKAVAETFRYSRSAAGKWVARARQRGYLPPTSQGRPSA